MRRAMTDREQQAIQAMARVGSVGTTEVVMKGGDRQTIACANYELKAAPGCSVLIHPGLGNPGVWDVTEPSSGCRLASHLASPEKASEKAEGLVAKCGGANGYRKAVEEAIQKMAQEDAEEEKRKRK